MMSTSRTVLITVLVSAALGVAVLAEDHSPNSHTPAIVPKPVSVVVERGEPFVLDEGASIELCGAPLECSGRAARALHAATGVGLREKPQADASLARPIVLELDKTVGRGHPAWRAAESYSLAVAPDGKRVEIRASDVHGLFNGIQTLAQLAEKGAGGKWRVPPVKIEDFPRFQWRGYLLDTVRHFRPKAEVFRAIDLMAIHKLNVLHLHLTDDQGWRVEIDRYPKLTSVGAALPNYTGGRGAHWFYTKADIKEIIAYAAGRHILVVPEIEMPGHSTAATTSYPELSCGGKPSCELCTSKPATVEFMTNVLDEVAVLFPSPYIHIGGDEVQPEAWRGCPSCKKRMDELAAEGLPADVAGFRVKVLSGAGRPFHEDIGRLQGDFIRRIDAHLTKIGKRMIGWDEILDGGLAKTSRAVIMAWRGDSAVAGAIERGRDVVVSVYPDYYLDNGISLARTYGVEPAPAGLIEEQSRHVLGPQGNMWGEHTPTQQRVDQQTYPRLCALAEVAWSPRESRDLSDFTVRLRRHAERLRPYGITFAISADK
jgi:hexosaminidase